MTRTPHIATKFSFMLGSAVVALFAARASDAQTITKVDNQTSVEAVVVTGTNIRGAVPVGANIVTMNASDIAATGAVTTQDLLTHIPALTGFGNQGAGSDARGGLGTADASGSAAPTIHGLGASGSNQTLVLVDGHRIPMSGLSHTLPDPSVIAPGAIQRVDVLPDGASAVYGSDASAGVINIITKKNYQGLEFTAQYGGADEYNRAALGVSFGHAWEDGAAMIAYNYSSSSHLLVTDRPYLSNDLRSRGGSNLAGYFCGPATVSGIGAAGNSGSTANIYLYPYTSLYGRAGNTEAAPCDMSDSQALLPSDTRHNVLVSMTQQFGDRISVQGDFGFASHLITTPVSRGTVNAMVYGPGSTAPLGTGQINPFYNGGSSGLRSEYVRYDFNDMLGQGAFTKAGTLDIFATMGVDVKLWGDWQLTLGGTVGLDNSFQKSKGVVSADASYLALNGTNNQTGTAENTAATSGSIDSYGLGTNVNVTRLPLTTANALDVWNPAGTNRTSQTVRDNLLNSQTSRLAQQVTNNVQLKMDGTLFALASGDVKMAVGGEYLMNNYALQSTADPLFGTVNTTISTFHAGRTAWAQYLEFIVPLISPDAGLPLVQKLDLDISGRHDHYDTFGDTSNPKVAADWQVEDGLKVRGSYGTSFSAPALTSLPVGYGPKRAASATGANQSVPASHVNAPGSWCASGCILDATHPGITLNGANDNEPETALTYSGGFDFDAGKAVHFLSGLRVSATYWWNKSKGLLTTPTLANEAQVPGLQPQLQLAPPGGWSNTDPAVLAAINGYPLSSALPPTVWYVYRNLLQNAFDIKADGIDFDVFYSLPTEGYGDFSLDVAGSQKLNFRERTYLATGPYENFLNGYNVNTTFSALALATRATLGWSMDSMEADLTFNYTNPYRFRTTNPPFDVATPGSEAGFQHIRAFTPIDLHLSYDLPTDWNSWTRGVNVAVTVNNIFDEKPPFYDSGVGYDPNNASPIGRVSMLSIRKKF
ncbi:MAG TPA: TonB-dependent receptor [Rhizomicrobium sp.]|jgi:iron complex outermembrane receptor protein